MSDLRDTIHKDTKISGVITEKLFLDYHENSAWAQAKVAAGLVLNPEAMQYMRQELEARVLRKKLYDEQIAKDKAAANVTGENNVNGQAAHAGQDAPNVPDRQNVQRSGQPDDAGHGADLQRPHGGGSGSQGQGGGDSEGQQGAGADLSADNATGPAAGSN